MTAQESPRDSALSRLQTQTGPGWGACLGWAGGRRGQQNGADGVFGTVFARLERLLVGV